MIVPNLLSFRRPPKCLVLIPALICSLAACSPTALQLQLAGVPDPAVVALRPAMIVDPPVLPGAAVAFAPDAEPRPVIYYPQPARISAPGEPLILPSPIPQGDRQTTVVEAKPMFLGVFNSHAEMRRLVLLLGQAAAGRFDALHLEIRGGNPGAVRTIVRIAVRAGVDPLKIRVTALAGPAEVIAIRYIAAAPVCPSLAIIGPSLIDNDFEPTLGCSTRRNLAANVNDPIDLLGNHAAVPADGARAGLAIQAYRSGDSQQRTGSIGSQGGGTSDSGGSDSGGSDSGGSAIPGTTPAASVRRPNTSAAQ